MKLKILGHEYDVQFDGKLDLNERQVGLINFADLWIKISPAYSRTRQEEALVHEITESLNFHLDLKLEHSVISSLSEGMYQVLKDNNLLNLNEVLKEGQ